MTTTVPPVQALCCSPVLGGELPEQDSVDLAGALRVLAEPTRLRIISLIRSSPGGRALTRDLVERLDVAQPTVSHHLGLLHQVGFLRREHAGRQTWYSVEPDAFATVSQLLHPSGAPASVA